MTQPILRTRPPSVYPARRVLEHVTSLDDVYPLRLFPVLWPLWQVETTARVHEEQAYEVIDRYLMRAVVECGFARVDELATFLGLDDSLVRRCLEFLRTLGHVVVDIDAVRVTELGADSVRQGVRLVAKESRQDLFLERFTGRPLPRPFYHSSVPILATPEIPEDQRPYGTGFLKLFAPTTFRREWVEDLAKRDDRPAYNLPRGLWNLQVLGERDAFLPTYVVETTDRLHVYTARAPEPEELFAEVCRGTPVIEALIAAEPTTDPCQVWAAWLADEQQGRGVLSRLPNGVLRATLTRDAFGDSPLLRHSYVGSFVRKKFDFAQVWCDDESTRTRALLDQVLDSTFSPDVVDQAALHRRAVAIASRLQLPEPCLTELRRHGVAYGRTAQVRRLDALD